MLPLTYFFKVMLCTAAFFGYYLIALRNKKFHQYNRFYLLFSVVASWLIPLIKFEITTEQKLQQPIYQAFSYIAESNAAFEFEPTQQVATSFNWMQLLPVFYFLIASVILIALVISLFKIYRIYTKYPKQEMENIVLLNTTEDGTPFSFFKYIFWNDEIDANSIAGKQILQHELTHVQEKHSWDKIFIQINLVFGWFNPCFWLIKKELEMIHEFIADNKAVTDSNAADFASMLLVTAFPTHQYKLSNPFFFSPIKRRLIMLTLNKNPRFSYVRRLIVLPLLAIVILLFAFRKKENSIANSILKKVGIEINDNKKVNDSNKVTNKDGTVSNEIALNTTLTKKYKIVIDAGHGGTDFGCTSIDGTVYEKDIDLAIAKAIKQLNINKNIEIVLTRDDDHFDHPKTKVEFINKQNADLCVSIHCNDAKDNEMNGTEIYVVSPEKNNGFMNESNLLAQSVNGTLKQNFTNSGIKTRKVGIWILQATNCPIILVETGFLSNKKDAAMLQKTEKQELIATDILKGIENYLAQKEQNIEQSKQAVIRKDTIRVYNLNAELVETKIVGATSEEKKPTVTTEPTPQNYPVGDMRSYTKFNTPTNSQWNEWKTKANYTIAIDHKAMDKNYFFTAFKSDSFKAYAIFEKVYYSDHPENNMYEIDFMSNDRYNRMIASKDRMSRNSNRQVHKIPEDKNGATAKEIEEIINFSKKYNPFALTTNTTSNGITEAERKRAFEIYKKMTQLQQEHSPVTFIDDKPTQMTVHGNRQYSNM